MSSRPSCGQLRAHEVDRARGGLEQLQDAVARGRLPRARLADEAQSLALRDLEADVVDRPEGIHRALEEHAAPDREVLAQPLHPQERPVRAQTGTSVPCGLPLRSLVGCDERTQCSFRISRSSGISVAQLSLWLAYGHRGAKRQATGGSIRSGGRPGIAVRRPGADPLALDLRQGTEERLRVRVLRVVEQLVHRCLLHDLPRVHDEDVVGCLGDDAHVVRDDDHRHVVALPQVVEEVEHGGLHGHVERGRGLVGDQELRVAGERDRDHHALAHAAREAVRVVVEPLGGTRDLRPPPAARSPSCARPCWRRRSDAGSSR